jgi:PAS domain S-box-containing protein
MCVFDSASLQVLEVNEAALAEYGYSRNEVLGLSLADFCLAEDVPALRADIESARTGARAGSVWRQRRKDGTLLLAEVRIEEIRFGTRPAQLMLAQQHLDASPLPPSERPDEYPFLQAILDEMPAAVFVQDLQGRFTLVNRAWERSTGVPRVGAVTRTVYDIFPRDVADRLRRADRAVLETGVPTESEIALPTAQGERVYLTQLFPRRVADGRIAGIVGLAIDITERKRADEHEARLSRVVEQAAESIVITDSAGIITYVNPAFEKVSGYSSEDAIGQSPRLLKSGHQDAAFYRRMWEALARGEVWKGLLVNRRKDGTLFQEEASIGPVRDSSGHTVSYVAVKRDITNEMSLERELLQARKMEAVGRLAGGVAHDFNNLLGVITGYGELTQRGLEDDSPLKPKVDQILKAAERAAGLTRQLLAFSRKQVLLPRVVDLNALVADLEKLLRRLIGEDVQLETVLDPELGSVKVDVGQIEQVVMNLVVNARDAMPDGGRVTIETHNADLDPEYATRHVASEVGPYVLLAVSDTGAGMDAETQAHLFEPFFTTKELGRGTGLGLSTVYGIVKQSGGYIWCYSELGVGTTFKIYLPRVEGEAPPSRVQTRPPLKRGSETILLIEDDAALRELLCESLGSGGYTVLVAEGGAQALQLAEEYSGSIHLIVTDVIMPGVTGRQVAERIKAARSELEILFISGYTDDAIARHGVLESGVQFLSKPFTPDDLLRKVREVLDAH